LRSAWLLQSSILRYNKCGVRRLIALQSRGMTKV
jgi:hypothetical protein